MSSNIDLFNERIGKKIDNLISTIKYPFKKGSFIKCIKCNEWFNKSFINAQNICANCVIKEEKQKEEIDRERIQIRKEMEKPKILFIYDTSWLMSPDQCKLIYSQDYKIEHIVLDSVKKEIMNHLSGDNDEKKILAGKARTRISEIMSSDGYTEYNEEDIMRLKFGQELLGPDSATDKLILSLADQYASTLSDSLKINSTFAFIFSHDGGIKIESVSLYKKCNKLVFTQSSIDSFHKLLGDVESLIVAKVDEGIINRFKS